ncbi:MAG: cysteine synthase family protein [Acidobacteria bacterium]|nr:cysteine synthase family protein [Acidobacteriota bacterium]
MKTTESILDLIGGTPLLRLGDLEPAGSGEVWAKLEAFNPGFSVKDRIGLAMVRAAEANGRLKPGGTIVEATAGNTGIALALAGRRSGYRVILVVPEKFSTEKQVIMRALGAELILSPAEEGMEGAQRRARSIAEKTPGAFYVDQFANPANPDVHASTTGPEIFEQTAGKLDAIVIGCGSGGTFTGTVRYLKQRVAGLHAVAVEPVGSILGGGEPGPHEIEGIGMDVIHPIVDLDLIDEVMAVSDPDAFATLRALAARCGVLAGSSGGANVWAAIQVAGRLGPGTRTVTMIPDSAERYLSKSIFELFPEAVL